jgi:hypothetical protein
MHQEIANLRQALKIAIRHGWLGYLPDQSGQTLLEVEVRGKRDVGYCKSMSGAVRPR